ncbi:MAG TPA: response regulator [Oscillatoriaceae cyanobacterium M33_DOE_052]|uniref:Response regulator n=1 Tax=Planktothricoides sp. SpSt-374 TaxID=2282167 RepID=A0A7C3ZKZ2_9CYAN|nr:response regulator [Oscillatoriaceae cyanobacterium M33_DOE_052]
MSSPDQPKEILLVEDSPSHQDLMLEALEETSISHKVHIVNNGEEALEFLRRQNNYVAAPRPHLILLDLNMPRMDGRELLAIIKADLELKLIPVVVFTTSKAANDVIKSYGLHANCYISKPSDIDKLFEFVKVIVHFWLNIVTLPPT